MMYSELYQYLIHHKQLQVPGIGTFLMERRPVGSDFRNKKMNPPVYAVALQSNGNPSSGKFFTWLADALQISDHEAIIRFSDFSFDMKKKIVAGDIITWNGVGTLSKGLTSEIEFVPTVNKFDFEQPVTAEKIIRKKAEHAVKVGEKHRTSTEMLGMLSQPSVKKSYWWPYALITGLLAAMFIGWHFSEHGLNVSSTANTQKSVPQEAIATYKILP